MRGVKDKPHANMSNSSSINKPQVHIHSHFKPATTAYMKLRLGLSTHHRKYSVIITHTASVENLFMSVTFRLKSYD